MKLYKKGFEIGMNTVLMIVIFVAVLLGVAFVIWQLRGTLLSLFNQLFG